ncbi:hypothetical protein B296_00022593 [Ensete ventricosum]|uniref:Uncharacterized protein n=1 Tax=Ensete ventricosum TaxID=4639 RepID=A0A426Y1H8_ENSVE|nr:hypothetical protein B296_00022593 [Ensete ventricosum]
MTKRTRRDVKGTNLYMQPDVVRERCRWWRGHRIPIPFLFHIIAIFLHFSLFSEANLCGARCERDGTGGVSLGVASKSREWTAVAELHSGALGSLPCADRRSDAAHIYLNRRLTASSFAVATPCFRHVRESGRNGDDIAGEVDAAGCYRAFVFLQPPGVDRPFVVP